MVSSNTRQAPEQLTVEPARAGLHGALDRRQQFDALFQQARDQVLGQIAFIAHHLTKEPLGQLGHGAAIINVTWSQEAGQRLALVGDDHRQLEPVESINRILAALGQPGKDPMRLDAAVVANHQLGRINEGEASATPPAGGWLRPPSPSRQNPANPRAPASRQTFRHGRSQEMESWSLASHKHVTRSEPSHARARLDRAPVLVPHSP